MSSVCSSISCLYDQKNLIYGLWDGGVRINKKGMATSISLKSPATAIFETTENTVYIGTADGDVWEIKNENVQRIVRACGHIKHTDINIQSVTGVHGHIDHNIIITYIYGEIVVYNTKDSAIVQRIPIEGKITSSCAENGKVLCTVDSKALLLYDIKTSTVLRMKALLSNIIITHSIFVSGTDQHTIAYATSIGKVCIDYTNRPGTGFVFKAHKQMTDNREMYYPVTLIKPATSSRIITGGADGDVHLWDLKDKIKVHTIVSTKKCILTGDVKVDENNLPISLMLVLSESINGLCEIEGTNQLVDVSLKGWI
ncbi:hypothetical protein NEIG_00559 [Nematocida sp. ERTm5]|nr:hypothetical protein NEIG_00559 [Nematocida sp. ERTm5]